jgi:hypothetical protein
MNIPIGTYHKAQDINPSNHLFFINPYWAATLFVTERFVVDWRLYYLWCGKNHAIELQPGQAIHGNYALAYFITPRFLAGINGYFLRQISDNRVQGVPIVDNRERLFVIGPGVLYKVTKNYNVVLFANVYFEKYVRSRPQGISGQVRLFLHF